MAFSLFNKSFLPGLLALATFTQTAGQDSLITDTKPDFTYGKEKQTLVEAYEKAFGMNRNIHTRLKAGFMDISNLRGGTSLPFLNLEQKISDKITVNAMLFVSSALGFQPTFYELFSFRNEYTKNYTIHWGTEARYYPKGTKSLSGNYFGFEFKKIPQKLPLDFLTPFYNFPYYQRNQLNITAGKQFGPALDIGLQAGIKSILSGQVEDNGELYLEKNYRSIPFLSMSSRISLGLDLPLRKTGEPSSCEFLNCYREFNTMFKINLSNLLYLDPYIQKLKIDLSYEKQLGNLPLSLDLNLISSIYAQRSFKPTGEFSRYKDYAHAMEAPLYSQKRSSQEEFSLTSALQLRYYPLQKRQIASGKAISNLSGFYTALSGNAFFLPREPLAYYITNEPVFLPEPKRFRLGASAGIQKKILDRYYYDFSIKFILPGKGYSVLAQAYQEIKLGYAF